MLHSFPSSLIEGRLRRHPEGGAGSGVLRRRLVTAGPGRPGTPPARHYDLAARSSLHGSGRQMPAVVGRRAPKETEARPRGPKPPRWSAERRASRVIANCRSKALHTGPPARAERIGTPQLSLRDSIAFYTAPLLYFGHLPHTPVSMPKPRAARLETPTARRRLAVRKI